MKTRILIVADQAGWIFERHAKEIKKRLTEYEIGIVFRKAKIKELAKKYDIVYVMDPIPLKHGYPDSKKTIMGLRCEFLHKEHPEGAKGLYEDGFLGRCVSIKDKCFLFHVVNKNMLKLYKEVVDDKEVLLAQHGVDESVFDKKLYNKKENDQFTIGIAGRLSGNKGGDILLNAARESGVKIAAAQYGNNTLSKEEMPYFYLKLDAYICLSKTEGLHNPTMEAGAMGVPVITTKCGASEEIIKNGENGIFIERNVKSLTNAINSIKNDKEKVKNMGENLYNDIMSSWTWNKRIEDFRNMFGKMEEII